MSKIDDCRPAFYPEAMTIVTCPTCGARNRVGPIAAARSSPGAIEVGSRFVVTAGPARFEQEGRFSEVGDGAGLSVLTNCHAPHRKSRMSSSRVEGGT
jgi:hypothetical protein